MASDAFVDAPAIPTHLSTIVERSAELNIIADTSLADLGTIA
jgi:hypothetical protein